MSILDESEFNFKFKSLLERYVLNNSDIKTHEHEISHKESNVFFFVDTNNKNQSICSLASVRLILLTNFVAKFLEKK